MSKRTLCIKDRYGHCTCPNEQFRIHKKCPDDKKCDKWKTSCKKGHTKRNELCPLYNKGMCKGNDNLCLYIHQRCSKPMSCKDPECKKGHLAENTFHSDKKEEEKKSPEQLSDLLELITSNIKDRKDVSLPNLVSVLSLFSKEKRELVYLLIELIVILSPNRDFSCSFNHEKLKTLSNWKYSNNGCLKFLNDNDIKKEYFTRFLSNSDKPFNELFTLGVYRYARKYDEYSYKWYEYTEQSWVTLDWKSLFHKLDSYNDVSGDIHLLYLLHFLSFVMETPELYRQSYFNENRLGSVFLEKRLTKINENIKELFIND